MTRYAAFLRGVNLGKNRRVKSEALVSAFEGAGFEDVSTFRASGNVIFAGEGKAAELRRRAEAALGESLGFEVTVFMRSAKQVRAIAAHEPFESKDVAKAKGKLQVALLPGKPKAPARKVALGLESDADRLALDKSELYWLPSGGISESDLDLKALEAAVGPWTMRTMGTIEQIAAKHCG